MLNQIGDWMLESIATCGMSRSESLSCLVKCLLDDSATKAKCVMKQSA